MKLADVAQRAKVSVTTVSRVLNRDENVKPSTRARVERAIEELRYRPNLHARSLARGHSKTLGMIVSNLDNPFFLDVYRQFEMLARAKGYETLVASSHYDPARLRVIVRSMIGRRVAGIAAIVSEAGEELIRDLSGTGIPVVFYDFPQAAPEIANIRSDYAHGVRELVDFLYDSGHRRIAFLAYYRPLGPTEERRNAFLAATRRRRMEARVITPHLEGFEGGGGAVCELLESGFAPTAVLCVNDIIAIGVLKELSERGIAVPEQISVTGFDAIELSEFTVPSLTTVSIPRQRIADLAFESLLGSSPTPANGEAFVLQPELIVRGSTGPARSP